MKNTVFIATSLDGYIADKHNKVDWLESIDNPQHDDMGYNALIDRTDALVMGRNTFELILSFDIDWPYTVPVYVLSHTLKVVPIGYEDKVVLLQGHPEEVLKNIHQRGHLNLYIDGGLTIQQFLQTDLVDEMIITTIPIVLGAGIPLFGQLSSPLAFKCVEAKQLIGAVSQSHYLRQR